MLGPMVPLQQELSSEPDVLMPWEVQVAALAASSMKTSV